MTRRPTPRLSPRLQQAMAMKAAAYTALSAGCWPIGGLLVRPDLSAMLAVIGLAFSAAAILAVAIYRRGADPERAKPLTAALVLLGCLAVAQLAAAAVGTKAHLDARAEAEAQPASLSSP